MAKKKTTKKKVTKKKSSKKKESKPVLTFEQVSMKFRGEKIIERKNKKNMDESKKLLKKIAAEKNLHGNYHGISITPNYKFLEEENIELFKENIEFFNKLGVKLPSQTVVNIDYDRLVELAIEKGITIPETKTEVVDLKALEKIFIKHEISANYQFKHYAFGLSSVD
jgi:hypothetical protein